MDVEEGGRTTKEVQQILESMGLSAASTDQYKEYLEALLERQRETLRGVKC